MVGLLQVEEDLSLFTDEGKPRRETEARRKKSVREPGLRERGPEDDGPGRGGEMQRTRRQWERGLTTDAQMHRCMITCHCVCGAGSRLRGWRRVEEVYNSCCGELGSQLAINEGIVERP